MADRGAQPPAGGAHPAPKGGAYRKSTLLDPTTKHGGFVAVIAAQPGGQALVRYFVDADGKGRAGVAAPGGGPGDHLVTLSGSNGSLTHCACIHAVLERVQQPELGAAGGDAAAAAATEGAATAALAALERRVRAAAAAAAAAAARAAPAGAGGSWTRLHALLLRALDCFREALVLAEGQAAYAAAMAEGFAGAVWQMVTGGGGGAGQG
ncbi:MAG: hypothetical protein J3K34DRAFT_470102 [Monoraphidium minutum]|nr:MAG: hypothetical protein J3K34DRAFT_470102 [Monoraphidium minutum]